MALTLAQVEDERKKRLQVGLLAASINSGTPLPEDTNITTPSLAPQQEKPWEAEVIRGNERSIASLDKQGNVVEASTNPFRKYIQAAQGAFPEADQMLGREAVSKYNEDRGKSVSALTGVLANADSRLEAGMSNLDYKYQALKDLDARARELRASDNATRLAIAGINAGGRLSKQDRQDEARQRAHDIKVNQYQDDVNKLEARYSTTSKDGTPGIYEIDLKNATSEEVAKLKNFNAEMNSLIKRYRSVGVIQDGGGVSSAAPAGTSIKRLPGESATDFLKRKNNGR